MLATRSSPAFLRPGINPTGTITFALYGPDDATCSKPAIFTLSLAVNGNGTFVAEGFKPRETEVRSYAWRVLGGLEALTGTLMVSWSTALMLGSVTWIYKRRMDHWRVRPSGQTTAERPTPAGRGAIR